MIKSKLHGIFQNVTKHRTARFALVGGVNTVIDFGVLFSLVTFLHTPTLVANIVSTSMALIVSYLLNKRAVFRNTDLHNRSQIIKFVIVTLTGLWILQGLVIVSVMTLLWVSTTVSSEAMLLLAKLTATAVTLTWNYLLYSRIVFKK